MKRARTITLLAMAAVATATALTSPAEAYTGAASAAEHAKKTRAANSSSAVRYAWLVGCKKKEYTVPCGPWRLSLRNGNTAKVTDAVVFPTMANGRVGKESNAPLAVSGDGTRIVYFRKSDHKLVWKNTSGGKAHSLPGKAAKAPKGIGMDEIRPTLSPDGEILVIDYLDASGKRPTLAIDLVNGDIARLPGRNDVQGFGPDGRRVLMSRTTDDNTTEFVVYDTDGHKAESREVPQIVSNNSPVALADDGVTIGLVIVPGKGRPRLRVYDLSTDTVSPAVDLKMPAKESPYRIHWDDSGKITLWSLRSNKDAVITRATASTVDPSTGGLKKIDSFAMRPDVWTWWLPGE